MLRSPHPDRRKDPYPGSEAGELGLAREGVGAKVETKTLAGSIAFRFSRHESCYINRRPVQRISYDCQEKDLKEEKFSLTSAWNMN
jgi:hypothetical protein